MAYSQLEDRYLNALAELEFPTLPPEPAPAESSLEGLQLAAGPSETRTDAGPRFGRGGVTKAQSEAAGGLERPLTALADVSAGLARGGVVQAAGLGGDLEMIYNGLKSVFTRPEDQSRIDAFLAGMAVKTGMATSEQVSKEGFRIPLTDIQVKLPPVVPEGAADAKSRQATANVGQAFGELAPLPGAIEAGVAGAKAIAKGAKELAPAAGEMFASYAARTGLTNYIVNPDKVYSGYAGEVQDIKPLVRLESSVKKLDAGKIDEQTFIEQAKFVAEKMRQAAEAKKDQPATKVRGADEVKRRLLGAKIQGEIDAETAEFAEWLLIKNPQLAENLGVSIKGGGPDSPAGKYSSYSQIATLFKGKDNPSTAVHEILHHSERMMPIEIQNGILDEWTKSYSKALVDADPNARKYLARIMDAINGSEVAKKVVMEGFSKGILDYDKHYQLVNPSEFWAVNATRLMQSRYEAGSWIGNAKVWLKEMTEKAKGAFGLPSDSPVLKGLKEVTGGAGAFKSSEMLGMEEPVVRSQIRVAKEQAKAKQSRETAKRAIKTGAVLGAGSQTIGEEKQ